MTTNNSSSVNVGGGGGTLLTIVFVILKVMGYIDWSWWWVFAPLWIPAAILAFALLVIGVVALLGE